jgi:hypothetical protein
MRAMPIADSTPGGAYYRTHTNDGAGPTGEADPATVSGFRLDKFRAGVYRAPPIEVPATKPGQRTDLGKIAVGTRPAPNPCDPLYHARDSDDAARGRHGP